MGERSASPAIVVAALALVAAFAGTALAGSDATTSAVSKMKVKKIAKKQAINQINELAPELSVASADTAANAEALGGKPPSAYASPTNYRIEQINRNTANIAVGGFSEEVRATCDPGERVVGGGGTASNADLVMIESWPLSAGTEWLVQFRTWVTARSPALRSSLSRSARQRPTDYAAIGSARSSPNRSRAASINGPSSGTSSDP